MVTILVNSLKILMTIWTVQLTFWTIQVTILNLYYASYYNDHSCKY